MKFLDNIKDTLGNRKINKILNSQKRKIKVANFASASSVGLLYQVSTVDYQDVVNNYIDYLRGEVGFKKIVSLGYCEEKELPNFILNPSMKYQFFTKKELDFSHTSKSEEVLNFIKEDFDILIDLSRGQIIPIKHIVASSCSSFKVGIHSVENEKYFDFMIKIEETAPASSFIKQVNAFLNKVNTN